MKTDSKSPKLLGARNLLKLLKVPESFSAEIEQGALIMPGETTIGSITSMQTLVLTSPRLKIKIYVVVKKTTSFHKMSFFGHTYYKDSRGSHWHSLDRLGNPSFVINFEDDADKAANSLMDQVAEVVGIRQYFDDKSSLVPTTRLPMIGHWVPSSDLQAMKAKILKGKCLVGPSNKYTSGPVYRLSAKKIIPWSVSVPALAKFFKLRAVWVNEDSVYSAPVQKNVVVV